MTVVPKAEMYSVQKPFGFNNPFAAASNPFLKQQDSFLNAKPFSYQDIFDPENKGILQPSNINFFDSYKKKYS